MSICQFPSAILICYLLCKQAKGKGKGKACSFFVRETCSKRNCPPNNSWKQRSPGNWFRPPYMLYIFVFPLSCTMTIIQDGQEYRDRATIVKIRNLDRASPNYNWNHVHPCTTHPLAMQNHSQLIQCHSITVITKHIRRASFTYFPSSSIPLDCCPR